MGDILMLRLGVAKQVNQSIHRSSHHLTGLVIQLTRILENFKSSPIK